MRGTGRIPPTSIDYASKVGCYRTDGPNPRCRIMRLGFIGFIALLWCGVIGYRLFSLQISEFAKWQDWALRQHFDEIKVSSERGPVFDRNHKLLAVSVPTGSIYVRPSKVKNKEKVSKELHRILSIPEREVVAKLNRTQPFVWIRRQIPRVHAEKVEALGIPGVGVILESRRFYPYNQAGSSLLGKVGLDGNGLSGIEGLYEKHLHGEHVKTRATRDALGNAIQGFGGEVGNFEPPKGNSLTLTIDAGIQIIMDEELEAGRRKAKAKSAMAVMLDADSGEILAMSQSPSFNFNTHCVPRAPRILRTSS